MKKYILFLILVLLAFGQSMYAQQTSTADKLYSQGVVYMKTMTVASQNKAIAKFEKAKVAFDSSAKKALCDEQITTCRNIIQKLKTPKPKPRPTPKPTLDTDPLASVKDSVAQRNIQETRISLNPSEVTISAKGGKYIEIAVECSNGDWKVDSCPEWISYTQSSTKLLIKAEKNKDKKNEKAGIITVSACNGLVKAELIVKQSKAGLLDFLKK